MKCKLRPELIPWNGSEKEYTPYSQDSFVLLNKANITKQDKTNKQKNPNTLKKLHTIPVCTWRVISVNELSKLPLKPHFMFRKEEYNLE